MAIKLLSETPITMAELKEDLQKIKQRDGELNFRAGKTEEYLNLFVEIDAKKAQEIRKKLGNLNIPRLREEHITKVIDIMPKTADELKTVMSAFTITIDNANIQKIVDVVKEYA